jgi:ribulose kinase
MKNYIGVDLGTQSSYFVIKNEHGNKLAQMKVFNDRASITKAQQKQGQTLI